MRIWLIVLLGALLAGCATTEVGTIYARAGEADTRARDIFMTVDGTGSSQITRTNAGKLFELVDAQSALPRERQLVTYYAQGVGSGDGEILGLAAGSGMGEDIRKAFGFLTEVWRPGDRVYLSGFSRGAYAVRALGGMIYLTGIPDLSEMTAKDRRKIVGRLYAAYKTGREKDEPLARQNDRRAEAIAGAYAKLGMALPAERGPGIYWSGDPAAPAGAPATSVEITALTVWDTVAAMGLPDNREDPTEGPEKYLLTTCNIRHAFQALALDDNRAFSFTPILIEGPKMRAACKELPAQQLASETDEVWFSGAHSDVGGSYTPGERMDGFLPGNSYNWMLRQLGRASGNTLFPAGSRTFADPFGPVHNAKDFSAAFTFLSREFRDPIAYAAQAELTDPRPRFHVSAVERLARIKLLDAYFPQCSGRADDALPPLLCSERLGRNGAIAELVAAGCLAETGDGFALVEGQECIVVTAGDDRDPAPLP